MTAALLVRVCSWCRSYIGAEIVAHGTEETIESHGACDACLLAEFMRQDAAEVEAA